MGPRCHPTSSSGYSNVKGVRWLRILCWHPTVYVTVLSQERKGGIRSVCNMANYSIMKMELVLSWAMTKKFQEYLLGHRFQMFTENNPQSAIVATDFNLLEPTPNRIKNVTPWFHLWSPVAHVSTQESFISLTCQVTHIQSRESVLKVSFSSNLLYSVGKSWTTAYHPAVNVQCKEFNCILHNLPRTLPRSLKQG